MKKSLLFLFLYFAFLFFLNCAKKEHRYVALVGDEKVTLEEFDLKVKNRARQLPATKEEELALKKTMLETIVQEKLLAQAAREMGKDKDESFINAVKEQEERFLIQTLYQKEVLDKSEPTERELKEFYKKRGEEVHARQILAKSEAKADEIYQQLQEGANFEELAKRESEDVATRDKGGDLGFFQWGKAVGPFQEAAFSLKPQEISKPVRTSFGWHIIKLEERRSVDQPEYEQVKDNLISDLRTFKQQEISYTFLENLKKKSGFKVNSTTLLLLIGKAEKQEDTLQARQSMGAEFNPAKFTPEEKDLVLTTFKGGELRLGGFLENYAMIPAFRKPGLDEELLEDLIYQMSLKPILIVLAQDENIDESERIRIYT
jgi:peptidyl-prolyl cis-trans isomerase C